MFAGEKHSSQLAPCWTKGGCAFISSALKSQQVMDLLLDLLLCQSQIQSSLDPSSSLRVSKSHSHAAGRRCCRIKGQEELVSRELPPTSRTDTPVAVRAEDLHETTVLTSFAESILCPSSLKLS